MLRALIIALAFANIAQADLLTQVTIRFRFQPEASSHEIVMFGEDYYDGHAPYGLVNFTITPETIGNTYWYHASEDPEAEQMAFMLNNLGYQDAYMFFLSAHNGGGGFYFGKYSLLVPSSGPDWDVAPFFPYWERLDPKVFESFSITPYTLESNEAIVAFGLHGHFLADQVPEPSSGALAALCAALLAFRRFGTR